MDKLENDLRAAVEGDVRFDDFSRILYSVDASLFRIKPVGVVQPRHEADVRAAVEIAAAAGVPIVPRGAATGLAGGAIGAGLVIDFSRYMNRILELDTGSGTALVEAGVVQDHLNDAVAADGWRFGPDTSTGNRATLGGMIGNNSAGAHSLRYGKTVDNIRNTRIVLADGAALDLAEMAVADLEAGSIGSGVAGNIQALVRRIRGRLADEIRARYPQIQRRVSGYNLDEMLTPDRVNLAKLFVGSEGTLGLCTQATVALARNPGATGLVILTYDDLMTACDQVPEWLASDPFAVEMMDGHIIGAGRRSPAMRGRLDWLTGDPGGLLAVEFDAPNAAALDARLDDFRRRAEAVAGPTGVTVLRDAPTVANVWALRKAGLGLLMSTRTADRAVAFLEDVAVPPDRLGQYARDFTAYLRDLGKEVGIYGHAGVGLLHFRPMLNLRREDDLELIRQMLDDVSDLVAKYGGAVSGEHGDGLARSWLLEKMYGPTLYEAFREVKRTFDPEGRMNPGKIVDAPLPTANQRICPGTGMNDPRTVFSFAEEGGFTFAVEMCNGNAECRKPRGGLMCPSFQVTGDERDSTRGRATALQAIVHGDIPADRLSSRELYEILEYCLECKGCKKECPSQVDMAKLKAEFLYHYMKRHGKPIRSRLFGSIHRINRLGCALAPVSNWAMKAPGRGLGMQLFGVHPARAMLPFAGERFSRWLAARGGVRPGTGARVVFAADTHVEHNFPELGKATIAVLEAMGARIEVVDVECCGRPNISKGLLEEARKIVTRVYARLEPYARDGWTIVGLEPSYVSVLTEEGRALCPGDTADVVAAASRMIDEYLAAQDLTALPWNVEARPARVWVHGHCHQKAGVGTQPTLTVLRAVPNLTVHEIDSGCCGMAGSFGYEAEHYEFSLAVGEQRLFPAIRRTPEDAVIVADGVSCRSQIKDGTGRRPRHLVEVLAGRLQRP